MPEEERRVKIFEALENLGVPVCHPPYKGSNETYITYQLLGQGNRVYAESREAETSVMYAVSIFSEGFAAGLLRETKASLEAAGYIVTVDMETYDKDTGRTQIALIAETEGNEYG